MNVAPATVAIPGYLVGTWKADPVHSEIAFSVRHLMVAKVRGRFTSYDVTIVTSQDPTGLVGCRDDRPGVRRHRQRTA
jgi:polyisoprenoid-binding protein YceI